MILPIDVIPNSNPPRFKWYQLVDSPIGRKLVDCQGSLQLGVSESVVALLRMVKELSAENETLGKQVRQLAAHAELVKPQSISSRKSKG